MYDFEQIKQKVLPFFIQFYGEEYKGLIIDGEECKDLIIKRMNKIVPVFYNTADDRRHMVYGLEESKRIELTLKFLEQNGINVSDEIKEEMVRNSSTYYLNDIPDANKILKIFFDNRSYRENVSVGIEKILQGKQDKPYYIKCCLEKLKELGIDVDDYNEWIESKEAETTINYINQELNIIKQLDKEYQEYVKAFAEEKEYFNQAMETKMKINEKYMVQFLQSLLKYLTDDDKQCLDDYLQGKIDYSFLKYNMNILKVIGDGLYDNGLLDAFTMSSEEKLKDPKISNYVKNSIINNRIKYYKLIGFDDSKMDSDVFLSTEEAKKNAPPEQFVNDVVNQREYYNNLASDEYI